LTLKNYGQENNFKFLFKITKFPHQFALNQKIQISPKPKAFDKKLLGSNKIYTQENP
jgi:hypothetical protein